MSAGVTAAMVVLLLSLLLQQCIATSLSYGCQVKYHLAAAVDNAEGYRNWEKIGRKKEVGMTPINAETDRFQK